MGFRKILTTSIVAMMMSLGAGNHALAAGPAQFNDKGELLLPQNYREWVMVGTQVTPNELNEGKAPFTEIRTVYVDPEGYAHWKKTGEFRDGTMTVKELISVGDRKGPGSGNGYFMGDYIGLEASVKDSKRFASEPGNWGFYIFYVPGTPLVAAAKNLPTQECAECHKANAKDDLVFTQFYPVLRAAKETGASGVLAPK
ncbi:cytochrome P460 family protein [Nitrosomonas sp. Is37]|uniref:cytochrome P460 family protein n=1 Tax=Nitrosomonas sp. Is37 TaxID=3080535 RepID=UPI00294B10C5|nr:cytochrome P460 family protein [Nitrosomonas sp. Is37]MDV6345882.1 cytochrome P460 family protein [Nitrosomonas sp. Is37]